MQEQSHGDWVVWNVLGFIGLYRDAIEYLATKVRVLRKVLGESSRRGIKSAGADLRVWQRLPRGRIVNRASYTFGLAN